MTLLGDGKCRGTCVHVKVLERYPVVRIRPLQRRLKHDKVIPGDQAAFVIVGDAEERAELAAPDLAQVALGRDRVHELLVVQVPAGTCLDWNTSILYYVNSLVAFVNDCIINN